MFRYQIPIGGNGGPAEEDPSGLDRPMSAEEYLSLVRSARVAPRAPRPRAPNKGNIDYSEQEARGFVPNPKAGRIGNAFLYLAARNSGALDENREAQREERRSAAVADRDEAEARRWEVGQFTGRERDTQEAAGRAMARAETASYHNRMVDVAAGRGADKPGAEDLRAAQAGAARALAMLQGEQAKTAEFYRKHGVTPGGKRVPGATGSGPEDPYSDIKTAELLRRANQYDLDLMDLDQGLDASGKTSRGFFGGTSPDEKPFTAYIQGRKMENLKPGEKSTALLRGQRERVVLERDALKQALRSRGIPPGTPGGSAGEMPYYMPLPGGERDYSQEEISRMAAENAQFDDEDPTADSEDYTKEFDAIDPRNQPRQTLAPAAPTGIQMPTPAEKAALSPQDRIFYEQLEMLGHTGRDVNDPAVQEQAIAATKKIMASQQGAAGG